MSQPDGNGQPSDLPEPSREEAERVLASVCNWSIAQRLMDHFGTLDAIAKASEKDIRQYGQAGECGARRVHGAFKLAAMLARKKESSIDHHPPEPSP